MIKSYILKLESQGTDTLCSKIKQENWRTNQGKHPRTFTTDWFHTLRKFLNSLQNINKWKRYQSLPTQRMTTLIFSLNLFNTDITNHSLWLKKKRKKKNLSKTLEETLIQVILFSSESYICLVGFTRIRISFWYFPKITCWVELLNKKPVNVGKLLPKRVIGVWVAVLDWLHYCPQLSYFLESTLSDTVLPHWFWAGPCVLLQPMGW